MSVGSSTTPMVRCPSGRISSTSVAASRASDQQEAIAMSAEPTLSVQTPATGGSPRSASLGPTAANNTATSSGT